MAREGVISTSPDAAAPILKFRVIKGYGRFVLECEADFRSGVTAVFGRSGSGKTTLLNCLSGMVRPDEGYIEIAGRPVYGPGSRPRHLPPESRHIGYVFQNGMLFPHMSVAKNIAYGHALLKPGRRTIKPDDVIDLLGLSNLLERPVAGLSGGEAQRVALARALASSPDLLLLDEPLSSLDAQMRGVIIRYLKNVRAELRIPMVLVSHSLSEVMALAEDTIILSEGRLVAQGPPARVLADPAVGPLADYPSLENLVEAEIVEVSEDSRPGRVRVGNITLEAPEVYGRVGEPVTVSIRAADIIVATGRPTGLSARNVVQARLTELNAVTGRTLAYFDVGAPLIVEITEAAVETLGLRVGMDAYLIVKTNSVQALNPR